MKLMKTGGAFYAPASSVYVMVEAILMNQSHLLPVAAYLQGEYQLQNLFLGVPCRLGRQGVQRIVELQLTESEKAALAASAQSVQASIEQVMACV